VGKSSLLNRITGADVNDEALPVPTLERAEPFHDAIHAPPRIPNRGDASTL
jgi:ribosome-binding ATPase YchF (GTP1/OBG family)